MDYTPITNSSMELSECKNKWTFDEKYNCWCLEDVIYTPSAATPKFQRLSIFAPKALLNEDGSIPEAAKSVPVVFENNSAGYMQMPHTWLGGPRCYAQQYLDHGLIYVTCGCRGRESQDADGNKVGKSPYSLIDLKTGIRFLRHNRAALPGDMDKIISIGWSAGGAMSSLIAVTGDNEDYLPYLKANGAFMDESDSVYAAQIYCPIIDLEHADLAYEWQFHADKTSEDSMSGPSETMSPFKDALSAVLSRKYIEYFNDMELCDPDTGEKLYLGKDGRSGTAYDYLMKQLNNSATKHFNVLAEGSLNYQCSAEEYISGNYSYMAPAPRRRPTRAANAAAHHAGQDVALAAPPRRMSLGEMVLKPAPGAPRPEQKQELIEMHGTAKGHWLSWDGEKATVCDLDSYILNHRRRMKPCTAFDALNNDSGENHVFGNGEREYVHFSTGNAEALNELKDKFPDECSKYIDAFNAVASDDVTANMVELYNPMNYVGTDKQSNQAKHYRIRVGASDADTAFVISMGLALKLHKYGCDSVDYALVWDQPHCEADYPGEVCKWIDEICNTNK